MPNGIAYRLIYEHQHHPKALQPVLPEIRAFAKHNHFTVLFPVLRSLAVGMELPPEDPFVKNHSFDAKGDLRQIHEVPVTALQIPSPDGVWRFVKHVPKALIVNAGDGMELFSGGYYEATIHRVVQPAADQGGHTRVGAFYFAMTDDDVVLRARLLAESPVLQRVGVVRRVEDEDAQTSAYGQTELTSLSHAHHAEQPPPAPSPPTIHCHSLFRIDLHELAYYISRPKRLPAFAMIMAAENIPFLPPKNPVPDAQKFGEADFLPGVASWFPPLGVTVNLCFHLCEVVAVFARELPSLLSDRVLSTLFKHPANGDKLAISPTFVVGFLFVVLRAAWRKRCYDTLGKFPTFQLALNKEHMLITTGPYAIVRHPAYTSLLVKDVGCLMTLMLPGSYMYESGMLKAPLVAGCAALWAMVHVAISLTAVKRVPVEDSDVVMREEFG
ncbi:hypothetical protein LXA43DRAFT_1102525 [Ganoderma leucocontextum]|nr:hypothetical protein LXA43DRAFT_1102525 [Ganoderma leucocontextum]